MRQTMKLGCLLTSLLTMAVVGCSGVFPDGDEQKNVPDTNVHQDALILRQYYHVGQKYDRWSASVKRNLTYCVNRASFGAARYAEVVSAMAAATWDWEAAADVKFVHDAGQDGNCTNANANVVFDVSYVAQPEQGFEDRTALGFFPSFPRDRRTLKIFPLMWTNGGSWTLRGYLRHELGHALGFGDEHVSDPNRPMDVPICASNNSLDDWDALTDHDRDSVMQYPQCVRPLDGYTMPDDLELSSLDKQGAAVVYGSMLETRLINVDDSDPTLLWLTDTDGDLKANFCGRKGSRGSIACTRPSRSSPTSIFDLFQDYISVSDWGNADARWFVNVDDEPGPEFCRAVDEGQGTLSLRCDSHLGDHYSVPVYSWGAPDKRWMADINGDGKADFCRGITGNMLGCSLSVTQSGAIDRYVAVDTSIDPNGWGDLDRRWLVDVTGDGRADYCRAVQMPSNPVWFMQCTTTHESSPYPDEYSVSPIDEWGAAGKRWMVSGEGEAEFCRSVGPANGNGSYLRCGEKNIAIADWGREDRRWVADIDGDGTNDLVRLMAPSGSSLPKLGYTFSRRVDDPADGLARPYSSCDELRRFSLERKDGNYLLSWNNRIISVYCKGMSDLNPVDYLNVSDYGNYSFYGVSPNSTEGLKTWFSRLRFEPSTGMVDVTDTTFTRSTGAKHFGNAAPIEANDFASAGDCLGYQTATGRARIDLTGTPLAVARNQFSAQGYYPAGTFNYKEHDQIVELTGGGYCGDMRVTGTKLRLVPKQ